MTGTTHIGLSFGRIAHWHDGLGEFSHRLASRLAQRAPELARDRGWRFAFHLHRRWHGRFGDAVDYLDLQSWQRLVHPRAVRFDLWHTLHQHIRLRPPFGTRRRVETVHDLNFLTMKSPAKAQRDLERMRRRLARLDAIATITQAAQRQITDALPETAPKMRVILQGAVDLSEGPEEPIPRIDAEPPYLLHVSGMAPNKNVDAILRLARAWPGMRFLLIGPDVEHVRRTAARLRDEALRNVSLFVDATHAQKAWAFRHAAGMIFPSHAEGFGLPVAEALRVGLPVFISSAPSLVEIAGPLGHVLDVDDAAAMRRTVEAALAAFDAATRAALRRRGHVFDWERVTDDYVSLYADVLAGRTAAP